MTTCAATYPLEAMSLFLPREQSQWPSAPLTAAASSREMTLKKTKQGTGVKPSQNHDLSQLTHEDLMTRIDSVRDRQAFCLLFDHFAPRIKSHLIKLGLEDHGAEDMAQDVMVTLWQKAHLFDAEKAKLSTWIFRIARNKFIDLKRKRKYPTVNADDHLYAMPAVEETDKPVEQKQDADLVSEALKTLSADQRTVIELSFYKEMSHSEIAEHLSLPLGTVKSRIRLAFQVLKKKVGEWS